MRRLLLLLTCACEPTEEGPCRDELLNAEGRTRLSCRSDQALDYVGDGHALCIFCTHGVSPAGTTAERE